MADLVFYHWSPTSRRKGILRSGLVPGKLSVDRAWRPPYVCFSTDPHLAFNLSIYYHHEVPSWDLWEVFPEQCIKGYEEIPFDNGDGPEERIKEYRVYQRIFKRDVWYVATRAVEVPRS